MMNTPDHFSNTVGSHQKLKKLLQQAYSAEKAAAFAYQGHAGAVKDPLEKIAIRQIEVDEWNHRKEVLEIMRIHHVPVSSWYEVRFYVVGKVISASCYVIGWFMPFYFAGRLESGNVCEYFRMKTWFNNLGIQDHDKILYEMGIKEKEHEIYFGSKIRNHPLLPFFKKVFGWSESESLNNVDLENPLPYNQSEPYCKNS